ncbi:MAG: tetratricopeptide repeat protein [Thermoanaerobaculia bacterium]|nr:tetratricopeptide repeat protein [Thermoanaerobaculia bacterium]
MRSTVLVLPLLTLVLLTPVASAAQSENETRRTVDEAIRLAQAGRVEEAIQTLEQRASEDGLPAPALGLLGALYLDVDRPERALAVLQPLAERPEASTLVLVSAARAAFALGDVDATEGWMGRAAEIAPESEAARRFGLYLGQHGRFAEAYRILSAYVEGQPEDSAAALALATAALKIGLPARAATALERVPADDPGAILLRGELALRRGAPHRARELLERAWGSHPPELDADLRRLLAESYLATGEAAAARRLLEAAPIADPSTAVLLSRALYQTGEIEAAAEALEPWLGTVHQLSTGSPPAQVALAVEVATEYGHALVALDRAQEAAALLRIAVGLEPRAAAAWNVLGHALIAMGSMEEAREAIGRYHRLTEGPPASDRAES